MQTARIIPLPTPGERAMMRDAAFPDAPPSQTETQLKLSVIAGAVAALLSEADALYGVSGRNTRSEADVLIGMREPQRLEKAEKAASVAAMQVIRKATHDVAVDWEDHPQKWYLEPRLREVEKACERAGEASVLAYWTAIREPHRFCACGNSYRNDAEIKRGTCAVCEVGGV